ncbi:Z1 domain-containing protein, partial [Pseudomonas viridiflava]|uniref:Z1 domain-containing protein n=1 Tax=Pseudomonas viridiflava TaxID=33069 RepID=UPI003C753391
MISCGIRRARGHADKHMTMLIHTSPNIIQHTRMAELISRWIEKYRDDLIDGSGDIFERMEQLFRDETEKVPLEGQGASSLAELLPYFG